MDIPLKRAEIVADMVYNNLRNGTPLPMGQVLKQAGFSKSTVLRPKAVTNTELFRKRMEKNRLETIKELEKARKQALKAMGMKIGKANYRDVVYGMDITTKNHQLLTGQATENVGMQGSLVILPSKDAEFEPDNG